MKITIPLVVGSKGSVQGYIAQGATGNRHEDIGILYDSIPEDEIPVRVDVAVELDMEALFKAYKVEGTIEDNL